MMPSDPGQWVDKDGRRISLADCVQALREGRSALLMLAEKHKGGSLEKEFIRLADILLVMMGKFVAVEIAKKIPSAATVDDKGKKKGDN